MYIIILHQFDGNTILFSFVTAWIGTRHVVTFMLFLGMANAYIMRTNMSVAIVAMVNHTAIGGSTEASDDECDAVLGEGVSTFSNIVEYAYDSKNCYF